MHAKIEQTFTLEEDQVEWLARMVEAYALPDASKAVRILLDYAIEEADEKELFTNVRCRHCG